jgi:glutamine amidotransferase
MKRRTIGIVDYDVGNLASVRAAVLRSGHRPIVTSDGVVLEEADLVILPGVGAFPVAMQSLADHGLIHVLKGIAAAGRPLLGICLGMQLLADLSFENGQTAGLGLIPGTVEPRPDHAYHIGWNQLSVGPNVGWLDGLDGAHVYFNHGYYFRAANGSCVATAPHGGGDVVAAVQRDNIVGVQFHPEKSQDAGDKLLSALIRQMAA